MFSFICPVIDHEFCHNIGKVVSRSTATLTNNSTCMKNGCQFVKCFMTQSLSNPETSFPMISSPAK